MTFSFPIVFWALLALIIPIIVHLFHFRRHKKILFTNVSLLKEILIKKASTNKLRKLLILGSRLLALLAMIFAFAYPFFANKNHANFTKSRVSLYLDNSFSMQAQDEGIRLLDIAKSKTRNIIGAFGETDEFQLICQGEGIRPLQWLNKFEALESVNDVEINSTAFSINEATNLLKRLNSPTDNAGRFAYLISDFQKTGDLLADFLDTTLNISLVPVRASQQVNISIDSVWFESPTPIINRSNQLRIKYTNHNQQESASTSASLTIDGKIQPLGALNLLAGESKIDTAFIQFQDQGWQQIIVSITDHPVSFDDAYNLTFEVIRELKILVVQDARRINSRDEFDYKSAFSAIPSVQVDISNNTNLNYSSFDSYNLIIIDELKTISSGMIEALAKGSLAGTNIYLVPNANMNHESYNSFLRKTNSPIFSAEAKEEQRTIGKINKKSDIFKDVYKLTKKLINYPTTNFHFALSKSNNRIEKLIDYQNGSPFLIKNTFNISNLYIQTAPNTGSISNMSRYVEIWIPMLYNMAMSKNNFEPYSFTIGQSSNFQVPDVGERREEVYKITGDRSFIPLQSRVGNHVRFNIDDQIETDGFYQVKLGNTAIRELAFNYNRNESSQALLNDQELSEIYPGATIIGEKENVNIASIIQSNQFGTPLWRYFIYLALAFLLAECLLIRLK